MIHLIILRIVQELNLPGVNGLQLMNGFPVMCRGHEQIGVKPLKLQSALTPVEKHWEYFKSNLFKF